MNTHEPNNNHDELITRWIDGELSDIERAAVEQSMKTDAGFAADVESAMASSKSIGDLLRSEFPASKEPPSPELFNARIMNHIRSESTEQLVPADNVIRPAASMWTHVPWLIAAAAVFVAAFIVFQQEPPGAESATIAASEISNTYAPRAGVEIRTRFAPEASATIVSLDGLESIPSNHEIEGELVASYLPTGPRNAPVFASATSGKPLFVLLTDSYNIPTVVRVPGD